jgi:hypothetical protein
MSSLDASDRLVRIGYGACAVMAMGTLAPWAELGPVTASGVDSWDGMATLGLAAIGAAALWRWSQQPADEALLGVVVIGLCALALTAFNLQDLNRHIDGAGVSMGWGLGLSIVGALALTAVGGLLLAAERASRY